jgi:hypothetical protein
MERPRVVRWTRRRLGAVAIVASTLLAAEPASAKRRRRKKRCKKLRQPCQDGGRKCCKGRTCGGNPANGTFCCQQGGEPCKGDGDCCNEQCVDGLCALN